MLITTVTLNPEHAPHRPGSDMDTVIARAIDADEDTPRPLWVLADHTHLILQSDVAPEWDLIPGAVSATSRRAPTHARGDRVHWSVLVTAERSIPSGVPGRRGKKVTVRDDELEGWLRERMGGLRLDQVRARPVLEHRRQRRYAAQGTGVVTDPDTLAKVKAAGLGTKKHQGCGLLLTWNA